MKELVSIREFNFIPEDPGLPGRLIDFIEKFWVTNPGRNPEKSRTHPGRHQLSIEILK
jgi:hypothetical protein